jgi:hypothetical protein
MKEKNVYEEEKNEINRHDSGERMNVVMDKRMGVSRLKIEDPRPARKVSSLLYQNRTPILRRTTQTSARMKTRTRNEKRETKTRKGETRTTKHPNDSEQTPNPKIRASHTIQKRNIEMNAYNAYPIPRELLKVSKAAVTVKRHPRSRAPPRRACIQLS